MTVNYDYVQLWSPVVKGRKKEEGEKLDFTELYYMYTINK